MKPIKVMFDIDGVLADFTGGFTKEAQKHDRSWPNYTSATVSSWDWGGLFLTPTAQKVFDEIKGKPDFHKGLPLLPDKVTMQRINELQKHAEVYFVTDRKNTPMVKKATEEWLTGHGIEHPTVVLSKWKGDFCVAAGITHAIDDKAGNAVSIYYISKGETKVYVRDRLYNRFDHGVVGSGIKRVDSVNLFLDDVLMAVFPPAVANAS